MNKLSILTLPLVALALPACATTSDAVPQDMSSADSAAQDVADNMAAAGAAIEAAATPGQAETEELLLEHIEVLASDDYMGRKPGTEGGRMTVAYQIEKLRAYGLEPGWNGSFEQPVPFKSEAPVAVALSVDGVAIDADDVVTFGNRTDFSGADLMPVSSADDVDEAAAGKVLVVTNPALLQAVGGLASSNGARGIVFMGGQALYERFKANAGRASVQIDTEADGGEADASPSFLLLGDDAAAKFNAAMGDDGAGTLGAAFENEANRFTSSNVIAKLPGSRPDAGAIVMMAHWDHTGECGAPDDEDRICNGAADNASGVAAILETARRLKASPQLERDVYIVGVTAEEMGLLGARYFADNPPRPLEEIHAALNVDMIAIAPEGKPLTVIGWNRTPLDDSITGVAASLGRTVEVGEESERYIRRQDGWALMNKGVPAVLVSSAFGDEEILNAFMSSRYHRANDEVWEGFELGGAAEDIPVYVALMQHWGTEALYSKPEGWQFDDSGE